MTDQPIPPKLPPHPTPVSQAEPALKGIRVADFSHFIAGPYCTLILGDLGADVIKVENAAASGDHMRAFRPQIEGESAAFIWANRNKRSIALDLTNAAGQEVARALIATADVVVENFSASVMRRFGFDYASVAPANPRLIYCSVSAYGRTGPLADRTGFDPIAQAESGFMSLNGEAGSDPLRTGPAVMDMTTGMMASNAVLAALNARHRTGVGQQVEVALFDVATAMLGFHGMNYLMTGVAPPRFGNNSRDTVPTGVFHCANGPIYLAIANDRLFHILVSEGLGRPDLAADPRFATNRDRVANRDAVFETLGRSSPRNRASIGWRNCARQAFPRAPCGSCPRPSHRPRWRRAASPPAFPMIASAASPISPRRCASMRRRSSRRPPHQCSASIATRYWRSSASTGRASSRWLRRARSANRFRARPDVERSIQALQRMG